MAISEEPVVKIQMLIRKPVAEVYEAFVDPAVTTQFWFTKGSGRLEAGAKVQWDWEMYGLSVPVKVKALEPNERILIDWGDPPETVEWRFEERPGGRTVVNVSTSNYSGNTDQVVAKALDLISGFALVLAGAKAWLEHGVRLNLVADGHPDDHVK